MRKRAFTIRTGSRDAVVAAHFLRESSKIWYMLDLGNAGETRISANLRLLEREVTGLNGRRSTSSVLAASCCHLLGNVHFGDARQDVKVDVWKKANEKTDSYVISLGIASQSWE